MMAATLDELSGGRFNLGFLDIQQDRNNGDQQRKPTVC